MNKEYDSKMTEGKMTADKNYKEKKTEAKDGQDDVKGITKEVQFQEKENKSLMKLLGKIEQELEAIAKKEEAEAQKKAAKKARKEAAKEADEAHKETKEAAKEAKEAEKTKDAEVKDAETIASPADTPVETAAADPITPVQAVALVPGDNERVSTAVVLLLFMGLSVIATSGYYMLNKFHNPMYQAQKGWQSIGAATEMDGLVSLGQYYQSTHVKTF